MQDFDTLRHRVEEAAERLSLAQSERQEETQSLIGILRHLEEKYSAQEKQFAYYRDRLEPLERSNAQLTSLIENLLGLIDGGFGDASLDPLRQVSEMASSMLETSIQAADDTPPDQNSRPDSETAIVATAETGPVTYDPEPEMATLDDIEDDGEPAAVSETEEDVQVIQDLVDLIEETPGITNKGPVAHDETTLVAGDDDQDEAQFGGVADLELEEVPLSYLDEDIEVASENVGADIDAVAATDLAGPIAPEEEDPAVAVAEDDMQSPADLVANNDRPVAEDPSMDAQFEDVSGAVLKLELEEGTVAGFDDLPEIVKSAIAAFKSGEAADEADSIAAVARAMEEETKAGSAPAPAPSDIRSLMLRVESLAKKADAMRLAQAEGAENSEGGENAVDDQEAAATAAKPNENDSEAAA